jgi:hypothetical protein
MVETLVDALIDISRVPIDGNESQLDLAVVGFASDVRGPTGQRAEVTDWVNVAPGQEDTVTSTVLGFADRKSGAETDYVTALASAQDLLIQRQSELGLASGDLCTAILWFTDGKFDLVLNSSSRTWTADLNLQGSDLDRLEAIRRGTDLLCVPGGLADQLRSASTHLLTFALLSDRFEGEDEALLLKVTLGADGCGEIDATATGAYFPGRVPDGIADCFYLALQGSGCPASPAEPGQCTATGPCVRTFVIDDSIDTIRLEYVALPSLADVVLRSPSGQEISLADDGAHSLTGVELRVSSATSAGFATLVVADGDTAGYGRWEVVNRPAEPGSLDLEVIAAPVYRLRLDAPEDAVRGEAFSVDAVLTGRSGQAIDPETVEGFAGVRLEIVDGDETSEIDLVAGTSRGTFTAEVVLPLENDALTADLMVVAGLSTNDGTATEIRSSRQVLDVISPGFIRVQRSLDVGVIEVERAPDRDDDHSQTPQPVDAAVGDLKFTAPRDVGGTACIGDAQWAIDRTGLDLEPERECISLSAGETGSVDVSLVYDDPQAGPLAGRLPVTVTSDLDDSTRTVEVAIDGQVRIPPPEPWSNTGFRLLFLLLGTLGPALAYGLASLYVSRFNEPSLVQMVTHPLSLHPYGAEVGPALTVSGEGSGFSFLDGKERSVASGSLTFDAPRRIIREPAATVASALGETIVTSLRPTPETGRSEIGHELNGHWVFVPTHVDGQSVVGEISALTRERSDARGHADQIIAEAREVLAGQRETLLGLLSGTAGSDLAGDTGMAGLDNSKYEW